MLVTLLGSCRHGQLEDSAVHALSEFAMHGQFICGLPCVTDSVPQPNSVPQSPRVFLPS